MKTDNTPRSETKTIIGALRILVNDIHPQYLVKAKHYKTGEIVNVCGCMLDDGFYISDGGELSYTYDVICWLPIPPYEEK